MPSTPGNLDILAIAAHRDDVEQTCGGTLLKMAQRGQRTGILDLTQGKWARAARLKIARAKRPMRQRFSMWRGAGRSTSPTAAWKTPGRIASKVASVIRETRPRVVILPYWKGRHPDHYTCSVLGYEACFLAGLSKLDPAHSYSSNRPGQSGDGKLRSSAPHRPFKIIYATLYYDVRPTFVVDISEQFKQKVASIFAYKSQYSDQEAGKDIFPAHDEIHARVESMARYYGAPRRRDLRGAVSAERSRLG